MFVSSDHVFLGWLCWLVNTLKCFTFWSEDEYIWSVCILSGVVSESKAFCRVTSDGSLRVPESRETSSTFRSSLSILDVDTEVLHSGAAIYPGTFPAHFLHIGSNFLIFLIVILQSVKMRKSSLTGWYCVVRVFCSWGQQRTQIYCNKRTFSAITELLRGT